MQPRNSLSPRVEAKIAKAERKTKIVKAEHKANVTKDEKSITICDKIINYAFICHGNHTSKHRHTDTQ